MLLLVLGGFFGSSESSEFLKKNEKRVIKRIPVMKSRSGFGRVFL